MKGRWLVVFIAISILASSLVGVFRSEWFSCWRLSRLPSERLKQLCQDRPNDARLHYRVGKALRVRGEIAGAAEVLERAISLKPDFLAARRELSELFLASGQYVAAYQQLTEIAARQPDSLFARLNLGFLHAKHGAPEMALPEFERAVKDHPDSAEAWFALGKCCGELNLLRRGKDCLKRALRLKPNEPVFLTALASLHLKSGEVEAAKRTLLDALSHHPDDPTANQLLAQLLLENPASEMDLMEAEQRLRRALQALRQAQGNPPPSPLSHVRGDKDGRSAEAFYWLGRLYLRKGQLGKAETAFKEAVRQKPDYLEALFQLGMTLLRRKKKADGEAVLRRFRSLYEFQLTVRQLRARMRREPDRADLHFRLARLFAEHGEWLRADFEYRQGLQLNPSDAAAKKEWDAVRRRLLPRTP